MDRFDSMAGGLNKEDQRTLQEIDQQVQDARLEGGNEINYPITRIRFDRLQWRIMGLGYFPTFIAPSGSRSSYMQITF